MIKIYILTTEPYPNGMAATNRILSYVVGFTKCKAKVKVIILKPTENMGDVFNPDSEGEAAGAPFQYAGKTSIKSQSFWFRRVQNIISLVNTFSIIRKDKPECVLLYQNNIFIAFLFSLLAKYYDYIYLKDESEAPNIYYKNYWLYRILRIDSVYLDYYYKLFDGLLLITDGLVDLLKTRIKKNAFIVKVPMTVDFERFNNYIDKKNHKLSYILYIGSLNENKDGVTTLIESFNLVAKKYKDINLILIGNALSNQYSDLLKHKVRSFGLQNKIKFISRISSSEIISYIFNAKVLALARPMSSQAEYGFPTKLGEYLASGKPVVVTKVGEIPRYLIDRENAYLAEPSNITSFAAKLDEALGDYDKAVMIGEQGKKTASENFDVYKNTKPVFDYIIVMLQKKQEHRK